MAKRKAKPVPAIDTVPASLLKLRTALGLSRRAMAAYLGMSQPEYSRIESGARQAGITTLQRVADGAGVPLTITFGDPTN